MGKHDEFDSKNKRPTTNELLGTSREVVGKDITGNAKNPPNLVPPRTKFPGRGDPSESLDRFSPDMKDNNYDSDWELDDDSDLATPEEITDPVVEANSQRNLVEDCPSTLDPTRFSHQNRAGRK